MDDIFGTSRDEGKGEGEDKMPTLVVADWATEGEGIWMIELMRVADDG